MSKDKRLLIQKFNKYCKKIKATKLIKNKKIKRILNILTLSLSMKNINLKFLIIFKKWKSRKKERNQNRKDEANLKQNNKRKIKI